MKLFCLRGCPSWSDRLACDTIDKPAARRLGNNLAGILRDRRELDLVNRNRSEPIRRSANQEHHLRRQLHAFDTLLPVIVDALVFDEMSVFRNLLHLLGKCGAGYGRREHLRFVPGHVSPGQRWLAAHFTAFLPGLAVLGRIWVGEGKVAYPDDHRLGNA